MLDCRVVLAPPRWPRLHRKHDSRLPLSEISRWTIAAFSNRFAIRVVYSIEDAVSHHDSELSED